MHLLDGFRYSSTASRHDDSVGLHDGIPPVATPNDRVVLGGITIGGRAKLLIESAAAGCQSRAEV
jgi:hypothetical protein